VVTAPVGSVFGRTDGGTNPLLYVKQTPTGNTGWNTVALLERAQTFTATQTFGTGVGNDGGGLKHLRVASCATAGTVGATCDTTVTWTTTFADTNYTASCSITGVTNQPRLISLPTKTGAALTVRIEAATAAAASGTIECVGIHD